jgi:hypothetical protein
MAAGLDRQHHRPGHQLRLRPAHRAARGQVLRHDSAHHGAAGAARGDARARRAAPRVECPSLQVVGEYDPLAPLDDVLAVYRLVPPPKEIWVCENDFHVPRGTANFGHADFYGFLANWLRDALEGRMPRDLDKGVLVGQKDGPGPYGEPVRGVHLPERLGLDHTGPTAAQRGPAGIREGWRIAPQNKKAPADAADAFS